MVNWSRFNLVVFNVVDELIATDHSMVEHVGMYVCMYVCMFISL